MKAGLFGGTFNPLHNGHIRVADHVKHQFGLDKIFFFPAATPPHKPNINLAPARDRYEMVKTTLAAIDGLDASDIEVTRDGPSFTIDTIRSFQQRHGTTHRFFLLMGSDAFFDTPSWKKKDAIFSAVPIIVMLRGTHGQHQLIASFLDEHISKGYTWYQEENRFVHDRLQPVCICPVPKIDISSTMIRHRVKQHLSIKGLVPDPVEKIISKRKLYL
ncbi:MAG: nicotinate-nucleotide adenylyltransferase [Desulfotignum sp.]|nr:nicotinate-nucleotide adenylyltransferase [Desulfotignum sp.]MCF8126172.1 nicotinate-nucleotide adenylyltransferase [Desulfotignum sp.]